MKLIKKKKVQLRKENRPSINGVYNYAMHVHKTMHSHIDDFIQITIV